MGKFDSIRLELLNLKNQGKTELNLSEMKGLFIRNNLLYRWQRRDMIGALEDTGIVKFNKETESLLIL